MQEIIAGHTRRATASWNRGKLIQDLDLFNLALDSACAKRRPQVSVEICRKITTPFTPTDLDEQNCSKIIFKLHLRASFQETRAATKFNHHPLRGLELIDA
jgi:hypothetical protein